MIKPLLGGFFLAALASVALPEVWPSNCTLWHDAVPSLPYTCSGGCETTLVSGPPCTLEFMVGPNPGQMAYWCSCNHGPTTGCTGTVYVGAAATLIVCDEEPCSPPSPPLCSDILGIPIKPPYPVCTCQ